MVTSSIILPPALKFKSLPDATNYTILDSDFGKELLCTGVMDISIPNGLRQGFYCTVTTLDIAIKTALATGTMAILGSLNLLETEYTSFIVRVNGLNVLIEGRLT